VIFCHGATTGALAYLEGPPYPSLEMTRLLCDAGRPVASFPADSNWGNSTHQGRIASIRTYGQANWGFSSGTVDILALSMGAAGALNWAKANPTHVNRIVLLDPAVDLQDIHANNRGGFAAAISTAWGGGAPSDANNPADNAASYASIPMKVWYSEDDAICTAATVTAFAAAAGAETQSLGAVGHNLTGLSPSEVVAFLTA
jgi:pimeloyl-ACP methyl ester carboxylesterase